MAVVEAAAVLVATLLAAAVVAIRGSVAAGGVVAGGVALMAMVESGHKDHSHRSLCSPNMPKTLSRGRRRRKYRHARACRCCGIHSHEDAGCQVVAMMLPVHSDPESVAPLGRQAGLLPRPHHSLTILPPPWSVCALSQVALQLAPHRRYIQRLCLQSTPLQGHPIRTASCRYAIDGIGMRARPCTCSEQTSTRAGRRDPHRSRAHMCMAVATVVVVEAVAHQDSPVSQAHHR